MYHRMICLLTVHHSGQIFLNPHKVYAALYNYINSQLTVEKGRYI